MNNLLNALLQVGKAVSGTVGKGFEALSSWLGKLWWLIVTFLIVPTTWMIDAATHTLVWITEKVVWMQAQVASIHPQGIGDTFGSFSFFLGILDNFVPVGFMFFLAGVLLTLWIVCLTIRVVIRFIPSIMGNTVGGN